MSKKITDENGNTYVQKKPFYKKAWFWIVVVLVVVIGGAGAGSSSKDSSSSKSTNSIKSSNDSGSSKSTKSSNSEKAEIVKTTPEEIVNNYTTKTSSQADAIYKGKTTQVTGKVSDVKDGILGGHDVTIDAGTASGNEFEKQSLTFNFRGSNKEEALSIQSGATITVQGKFSHATIMGGDNGDSKWVSDVSFTNSSLVK
ncbi:Membrane protein TolA involved in colicin uptake (TolA) [Fructobacillus cardui]|uniref:OB-fold protein n=1 Tax=Fructobacillus cardui TaxID=2893170 RepID=UPI002DA9F4A5|nr:Membrane protein TolA involved in colicin uptake (TolA) [Fructobacillus cardui]